MGVIGRKLFTENIDTPKRGIDTQQRIYDNAILEKNNVKNTSLLRLHSVKSEVTYYEQVVSDKSNNLVNNAALSAFDPNITRFRKIVDFVIITDELDAQTDKQEFTNVNFEGSAKILPHTLVPNINDFFIMKVFDVYHLFKVIEINPVLVEKDAGYEIRFSLYRQNIIPENCELNPSVKESFAFDYNHVGTDFRTILKTEESQFVERSRDIMYTMMKVYSDIFYHKTLNTFMVEIGRLPDTLYDAFMTTVANRGGIMVGNVLLEGRTLYDVSLVSFMNKFEIYSPSDKIFCVTEHLKPIRNLYNGSIFSAIENMKISRFVNDKQLVTYCDTNLYSFTNKLHGRFYVDHVTGCNSSGQVCAYGDWVLDNTKNTLSGTDNFYVVDLFPTNFTSRLKTYDSDAMYNRSPSYVYTSVLDILIDIISTFINETEISKKRSIILRLTNLIYNDHMNFLYENDFEYSKDIFYTYPLVIYVLKYMTREILLREYK